jgi:hypothetical protein
MASEMPRRPEGLEAAVQKVAQSMKLSLCNVVTDAAPAAWPRLGSIRAITDIIETIRVPAIA